jgi:histidyl-tRNA synthetase
MFPESLSRLDAVVAAVGEEKLADALRLAIELRGAGLHIDLRPNAMKPGKLRQYAQARGADSAIWIEPEHAGLASVWMRGSDETHRDLTRAGLEDLLRNTASQAKSEVVP